MTPDTFLSPKEIDELTGIRTGRAGVPKLARQIDQLRAMGVPHLVNAVGRPMVARTFFDRQAPTPKKEWAPRSKHA